MFAVFKFAFHDWECIGTMPTIEQAIDFRDGQMDESWENAFDRWEHHAIISRIDEDTTAIVRDDDTSNVWEAFTIKEIDFPKI